MNAAALEPALLGPRPWRTFLRMAAFCCLPTIVLGFLVAEGADPAGSLFVALFMVAEIAMAVATSQRELLAPAFTFLQPGLRPRWRTTHLAFALVLGLAVAGGAIAVAPGLTPAILAGLFGLTLSVYAVFAFGILLVSWSFQFPMWLYFLFFLIRPLGEASAAGKLSPSLVSPWLWLPVGAVLLALLIRTAGSRGLQRRLWGVPSLVMEDIFRPSRLQAFRTHRERGQKVTAGPRWRARMLGSLLARSEKAVAKGRPVCAGAWRLVYIAMAENVGHTSRRIAMLLGIVPVLIVVAGYFHGAHPLSEMRDWYPSICFLFAVSPLYSIGLAIRQSLAHPGPRSQGYRAEYLALVWASLLTAVVALVVFGLFQLGVALLPALTWGGRLIPFAAPSWHGMLVVALLGPAVLLDIQFRPHSGACTPSFGATLLFFFGLLLLTVAPGDVAVPAYVGATFLLGMWALRQRRRWWLNGDLPL